MAKQDGVQKRILKDYFISALGGVDGGKVPSLLDPNQLAHAVNVTLRGGSPTTRPGFPKRILTFGDDEQETWFKTHQVQGAFVYRSASANNFIVASVGGRLFKIEPLSGYTVSELTPTKVTTTANNFVAPGIGVAVDIDLTDASTVSVGYPITVNGFQYSVTAKVGNTVSTINVNDPTAGLVAAGASVVYFDVNSPSVRRVFFEQARQWLIAQNGLDAPYLFDGGVVRRSVLTGDKPEVPVGTVMAFTNNRLWVAVKPNQVAAGDIAGGPTDVINFTEELGITGPARFQIDDEITAMAKTVTLDTSLGQGPLQIFTRNGAASINVPAQRALWTTLSYAPQTVSLNHAGATSQYATLQVNSDIHYRAPDGWRSFILSRRESSEWGNVPLSAELARIIDNDDETLLEHASAILLDNRVIFTKFPHLSDNGIVHEAMVAFDLDTLSSMGKKAPPVWEGEWTGLRPTLIISGEFQKAKRGFVFHLTADNENELWEIDSRATTDNGERITSSIESRSFPFQQSNPFDLKKVSAFELWPRKVRGTVDFVLQWRPDASEKDDEAPCWYDWGTKTICTRVEDCDQDSAACKTIKNFKAGYRNRLGFGTPSDDDCEPQTQTPPRLGFEHQIKLTWTGYAAIRKFEIKATLVEEDVFPPCDE